MQGVGKRQTQTLLYHAQVLDSEPGMWMVILVELEKTRPMAVALFGEAQRLSRLTSAFVH